MSVRVMTLVWNLSLPDSQKIVLLALADSANDDGFCWPSMAGLVRKCSKSARTIQGVIKQLVDAGHLTRNEVVGKGCNYTVHPRSDCAPAEIAPTPAAVADHPRSDCGVTVIEPSRTVSRKQTARPIPDDWKPLPFGMGTKSRAVVDGWPPGELESQAEHFTAHHRAKGSRFVDWQDAWSTWVLNSQRFSRNGTSQNPAKPTTRQIGERVAARLAGAGHRGTDGVPRLGPPGGYATG